MAPDAPGRGVARLLIEEAITCARRWEGIDVLALSVTDEAADARRVYERAGFVCWGSEPRAVRHAGRDMTEHHMSLSLD